MTFRMVVGHAASPLRTWQYLAIKAVAPPLVGDAAKVATLAREIPTGVDIHPVRTVVALESALQMTQFHAELACEGSVRRERTAAERLHTVLVVGFEAAGGRVAGTRRNTLPIETGMNEKKDDKRAETLSPGLCFPKEAVHVVESLAQYKRHSSAQRIIPNAAASSRASTFAVSHSRDPSTHHALAG